MRNRETAFAILALSLLYACGASESFQPTFREVREPGFSATLADIERSAARTEEPLVLAVTKAPMKLFAWRLADAQRSWEENVDARSMPLFAGSLVVTQEAGGVVARNLSNGHQAFTIDDEGARLVGADGVGAVSAISLATGTVATPHGSLVIARGDDIESQRDLELPVGVPAVTGELVIVPWATQRVTVLDARTGRELSRLRIRDDVIGHAFVDRGSVYLGQLGLFRLTRSIERGTKTQAAYTTPASRPLPGQPGLMRDGYEPAPPPDSAHHRVRLVWRPAGEGETVRFQDDVLYLVFYRMVFALDAGADTVRWAQVLPTDVVGATALDGGLLVAEESGKLSVLTASAGQKTWEGDLGQQILVANFRPGTWTPPASAPAAGAGVPAPSTPATGTPAAAATASAQTPPVAPANAPAAAPAATNATVRDELIAVARLDDARLPMGRQFAIQHLVQFPDAEITALLIDLCGHRDDAAHVAACDALATRTEGADHVVAALEHHRSFLRDVTAPPVGALSRAAAHMNLHRAAPLLLAHVMDRRTSTEDLVPLFEALRALDYRAAVPSLESFVRLYHAESADDQMGPALAVGLETLIALKGHPSDPIVQSLANDPFALPALRNAAAHIATQGVTPSPQEAQAAQAVADTHAQAAADQAAHEHAAPPPPDTRPEQLTGALIAAALAPVHARLVECLGTAADSPPSSRIAIVIDDHGAVSDVVTAPATLQACIEPIVRERHFPETRSGRQQVTFVVQRRATPAAHAPAAPAAHAPAGHAPAGHAPVAHAPVAHAPVTPATPAAHAHPHRAPDAGVAEHP